MKGARCAPYSATRLRDHLRCIVIYYYKRLISSIFLLIFILGNKKPAVAGFVRRLLVDLVMAVARYYVDCVRFKIVNNAVFVINPARPKAREIFF